MEPKVTLLTHTKMPLETVYSVWEASKTEGPLRSPEQIAEEVPAREIRELFMEVIKQRIPIGEHVDFVFMMEGVSVSWREQAVRHRIGTGISPERLGIDLIPDLANSSWWSQSMRLMDMSKFATNGMFRRPETLNNVDLKDGSGMSANELYVETMGLIEDAYYKLVQAGVPMEDARELIPLGAQHRISWKLNIGALQHIVGKRGCQILQLGIWGPVIQGMISELASKVDPIFQELVTPPCLKMGSDVFDGCVYEEENRRRYSGQDDHPPCSLHAAKKYAGVADVSAYFTHTGLFPKQKEMQVRAEDYQQFWGRDPYSGKRLRVL